MIGLVNDPVVDQKAAAEYLKVSEFTIVRRAKEGVIGTKIGKCWRFRMSELQAYASNENSPHRKAEESSNGATDSGHSGEEKAS